uniref:Uncharacterized protein n=1 Tax=Mycena chlorophos TaxID=658473 RepID=A0ABQ0LMS5_MYCCL|nr:predicted protein [Mycena chlorophos]
MLPLPSNENNSKFLKPQIPNGLRGIGNYLTSTDLHLRRRYFGLAPRLQSCYHSANIMDVCAPEAVARSSGQFHYRPYPHLNASGRHHPSGPCPPMPTQR